MLTGLGHKHPSIWIHRYDVPPRFCRRNCGKPDTHRTLVSITGALQKSRSSMGPVAGISLPGLLADVAQSSVGVQASPLTAEVPSENQRCFSTPLNRFGDVCSSRGFLVRVIRIAWLKCHVGFLPVKATECHPIWLSVTFRLCVSAGRS